MLIYLLSLTLIRHAFKPGTERLMKMQKNTVLNELKEIVYDYLGDDSIEIREDSILTDDLGLTSLDLISIVGDVENSFAIAVDDADINSIETVSDVAEYVLSKISD